VEQGRVSGSIKPYVYLIGPADRGPVKIGFSGAPEGRLRELQTGHPEVLCILAMFPGGEDDEQMLHKFFATEYLRGEWFRRTPRVCKFINMMACRVSLATAMHACRTEKEKRQELRQLQAQQRKREQGRVELAKLIASGTVVLLNAQGVPVDAQGFPIPTQEGTRLSSAELMVAYRACVPEKTKRPPQEANPAAANSISGETCCGPSSTTARAVLIADRAS
jgi:hypothetical protein